MWSLFQTLKLTNGLYVFFRPTANQLVNLNGKLKMAGLRGSSDLRSSSDQPPFSPESNYLRTATCPRLSPVLHLLIGPCRSLSHTGI